MKYIYFLKYNNYANRIFKRETNMSDYLTNSYDNTYIRLITDCAMWNPNDGITAQITTPTNTDFSIEPDYLIAADEYNNIDSRWFITETVRDRKGQYQCYLKRDVFADAWDELMDATCNIDRAILPYFSPLAYNPEPITVNQINKKEVLIKDKTKCPWIVFYGDMNTAPSDYVGATISRTDVTYNKSVPSITDFVNNNSFRFLPNDGGSVQLGLKCQTTTNTHYIANLIPFGQEISGHATGTHIKTSGRVVVDDDVPINDTINVFKNNETYIEGGVTKTLKGSADAQTALSNNGLIVYDTTDELYYEISVEINNSVTTVETELNGAPDTNPYIVLGKDILEDYSNFYSILSPAGQSIYGSDWIKKYDYKTCTLVARQLDLTTVTASLPNGSYKPKDAPYYIWCMPYGEVEVQYIEGGNYHSVDTDKDLNLRVINELLIKNANAIYDAQILPFCPLPDEFITNGGDIDIGSNTNISDTTTMLDSNNDVVGFIFSCPVSSFKQQIRLTGSDIVYADEPKLDSITKRYRLYSPNYASSFEFSVAKNEGLRGFNVRCTYMPFNPYIRVAPIWGGLYGINEDEVRGLVCSGDYSLPRVNDAWATYQQNNKNYEAIFNRQIDNMDTMRTYQRAEDIVSAVVGTAGGATIGSKFGGLAGGLVGGIGGAIAGAADITLNELRYQENRSYATDIHEMQLGNIQAMPRTLSKTTAFNIDNRYFPVFTVYSCTEEERNLVIQFIVNRSMNVGAIGKPSDYVNNGWINGGQVARGFIQGSIININSIHDTHFVDELNNEFQKGVFMR